MESLEEVIRFLQAMSQNMNNKNRAVLPPWQQNVIDEAGHNVPSTLNEPDLRKKAEKLDVLKLYGDYANAKYFCFVPNPSQNQYFMVYVIDGNHNIIAKLEQLQIAPDSDATQFDKAFIIPIR